MVDFCNVNSGFLSVILCTLTILLTGFIGYLQIRQNKKASDDQKENDRKAEELRIEIADRDVKFQKEISSLNEKILRLQESIDARDEMRHNDYIDSLAYSFINENASDLNYLPLCIIASMYNRSYNYNRPIYNKYCSCSKEVQDRILEIKGIKIERLNNSTNDFYSLCLDALIKCISDNKLYNESHIYYDSGKYFERTLTYEGKKLKRDFFYERERISDVLARFFRDKDIEFPMDILCKEFRFENAEDEIVYLISCEIAKCVSIYSTNRYMPFVKPIVSEDVSDVCLEDVFLDALLYVYYYLVMEYEEIKE